MSTAIGAALPRREDARLVTGAGCYTDDVAARGAAHAVFVRSPFAHARVTAIRAAEALAAPGVLAVLTAAEYAADGHGGIPHVPNPADAIAWQRPAFARALDVPQLPLAAERVRHAGEAVAMVVAETAAQARDAAELVDVAYEELPAVLDAEGALAPGAPRIRDEVPGNLCFEETFGETAAVDEAFATAHLVVERTFRNQRIVSCHMEPRAALASYDAARETYRVVLGTQGVMKQRAGLAAALGVAPERVEVVTPDVGGAFGSRTNLHPEPVLLAWAARRLGRAVRWTSDRGESFVTDYQGRDLVERAALAFDARGRILALRADVIGNAGAHTVSYAPLHNCLRVIGTVYDVPVAAIRLRAALTNTVPTAPYRGAGRPEATFAIERLLDVAARRLGIDRIALRETNLVPRGALPYRSVGGLTYDSGHFSANMRLALARADWDGFPARRAASAARGMLRGIGLANYVEAPVGAVHERVVVRVARDGTVEIRTGTQSSGQGHETTFAQVVADALGVAPERVVLRTGDSTLLEAGGGTHSNRSMRIVGTLLLEACAELREKLRAGETEPVAEARFSGRIPAHPTGCAICEVEIDPRTGTPEIVRYTSIDDVGKPINPTIVDGQIHGGIAQAIGQALFERGPSSSFLDYAVPRAAQLPRFDVALVEDPTTGNPLGVKGGGEGGVVPGPAAVVNAIVDALGDPAVEHLETPVTPETIWRALRRAAVPA